MPRRNPQPAWRAAVVGLVWSVFMYYCIYRQPLRDLTERLTRSDTVDKPFILGAITLPIVALCDKIKLEEFLWASAILYHATSTFCKVAPNTTAFFVGQVFAGASASSVIYGTWKWILDKMIKAAKEIMLLAQRSLDPDHQT